MLRVLWFLILFIASNASAYVVSQISFRTYFFGHIGADDYFKKDLYLGQMYGGLCLPDMNKQIVSIYSKYDNQNYISFNVDYFNKYVPVELYKNANCFQFRLEDLITKNCLIYGSTLSLDKQGKLKGFVREAFYNRSC